MRNETIIERQNKQNLKDSRAEKLQARKDLLKERMRKKNVNSLETESKQNEIQESVDQLFASIKKNVFDA